MFSPQMTFLDKMKSSDHQIFFAQTCKKTVLSGAPRAKAMSPPHTSEAKPSEAYPTTLHGSFEGYPSIAFPFLRSSCRQILRRTGIHSFKAPVPSFARLPESLYGGQAETLRAGRRYGTPEWLSA